MKRTGFVIAIIGLVIGLVPTIFYVAANFGELYTEDWYAGASKFVSVLDVVSGIVVLIGFVVIASTLGKVANGPFPGTGFPPPQFPPPGYPQGSPASHQPQQPGYTQGYGQQGYGQQSYGQQAQAAPSTNPPDLTK